MIPNDRLTKRNHGCDSGPACSRANCVLVNNKLVPFRVFLGISSLFAKSELFKRFYDHLVERSWIWEILTLVNFATKKI